MLGPFHLKNTCARKLLPRKIIWTRYIKKHLCHLYICAYMFEKGEFIYAFKNYLIQLVTPLSILLLLLLLQGLQRFGCCKLCNGSGITKAWVTFDLGWYWQLTSWPPDWAQPLSYIPREQILAISLWKLYTSLYVHKFFMIFNGCKVICYTNML